jgi:hypothetical protein
MALAVLVGTAIRTGVPGAASQFGAQVGGLRALSDTETLLLFEDGTSGVPGWSTGRILTDHIALGPVWLAEPPDVPLTRSIALPEGTVRAVLSFDLVAIDDWALQGLSVSVDGAEVLRQRFTSRPDQAMPAAETLRSDRVALRARMAPARELGFAADTPNLAEQVLSVDLAVFTTGDTLTLTIAPLQAEGATDLPQPLWAIDNLIVTGERLP